MHSIDRGMQVRVGRLSPGQKSCIVACKKQLAARKQPWRWAWNPDLCGEWERQWPRCREWCGCAVARCPPQGIASAGVFPSPREREAAGRAAAREASDSRASSSMVRLARRIPHKVHRAVDEPRSAALMPDQQRGRVALHILARPRHLPGGEVIASCPASHVRAQTTSVDHSFPSWHHPSCRVPPHLSLINP